MGISEFGRQFIKKMKPNSKLSEKFGSTLIPEISWKNIE